MRYLITILVIHLTVFAFSQQADRPFTKRIIVKTNVLSLVAQRPTITIEKAFTRSFSTEVSFVQGQFNNFLFTDHYDYNGFLIRARKYLTSVDFGSMNPYLALYIGNLKRNIRTTGQVDNTGFWSYPSRDFSANSIRGGGSIGLAYISKSKIVIDGLVSMGYGAYTKVYKPDVNRNSKGYLDAQVWLSIGYCF